MQSWGTQSRFGERDTGLEPSKSGAIGLLCAALGRARTEPVDDLASMRMGVRIDREGTVARDFHTLGLVVRPDGKKTNPFLSNRYYLADASFLVGFESADTGLLERLQAAVASPRWQLFLGRKSFVPGEPPVVVDAEGRLDGVRALPLFDALREEPLDGRSGRSGSSSADRVCRFVIEVPFGPGVERRFDQPAPGAAYEHRQFLPRYVQTRFHRVGAAAHDPDEDHGHG